jgi:Tfp pilus assembly protein PilP
MRMPLPAFIVALCLSAAAPAALAAQAKPAPAKPEPAKPAPAPAVNPAPPQQAPAAKPAPPQQEPVAKPAPPPPPAPLQSDAYNYDPSGRRDPFVSLIATGTQPRQIVRREGKAGLLVGELSVRGVMLSQGNFIAMVQGPDGKTFLIHSGDQLADGVVKSVNAEGLVVVQDVNDPLSLVKQREVSKKLRSLEVKQ